jgi:hypothetical protein
LSDTADGAEAATGVGAAPGFWIAVLRQALPVAGVLLLGWPVAQASVLFLVDLWLALTLRTALELTFQSRAADASGRTLAGHLAFFGLLYGIVVAVGAFGQVVVGFPQHEWRGFLATGWRDPVFLGSLVTLVSSHAWESARYRRHLDERTESEAREDDVATRAGWSRLLLVCLGTLFLPLASAVGYGAQSLVVVIALVNVAVDAFPVQVGRRLGFER